MRCLKQELKNVQLFERNHMRQPIKLPFMHNCVYAAFMLTSEKRDAQKKRWRTKLRRWSYLYLKVVCLTFFCLDFFEVTEKYTLYNVRSEERRVGKECR